ncbi:uncharacterized protein YkwD [Folsomia candida]|uniref:Uncharacterized protein YkwD n=1 Tax=Folsomia candida TaxID=158441 RepID=A0A226DFL2_FOLCA|nr:uncharacterized protein YkwD [Folsomia candida]OXA44332.1 Uncharacterized protein YkwD [Folsomia candida]
MKLFIFIAIIATASATPVDEKEGDNIGEPLYQTTDYLYVNDDFNSIQQSGLCLAETNSVRARNGKGPLAWDGRLESAARNHNNVMVAKNCFSHQCPGEPNLGTRVSQVGYTWTSIGENIASGYPDCNAVVNGWMNSAGHRENILRDYLQVGCHRANQYWTCVYARGR